MNSVACLCFIQSDQSIYAVYLCVSIPISNYIYPTHFLLDWIKFGERCANINALLCQRR